jgi:hypothetical protein
LSLKVYHVEGLRHCAVVFALSEEDAVAEAIKAGLVGQWEMPAATEIPLPPGHRIIYDQWAAAKQSALPLALDPLEEEPPHTITRSGVKVYDDWRHNIVVDPDAPPPAWKAGRDTFGANTSVPGASRVASENSEDALSWNLFRTLEKTGHLDVVTRPLGLDDAFQVLYWYHPWDSDQALPEIKPALDRVEPWGRHGGRFQTETDVILKGQRYLVMVESKLGKPGTQVRAWERSSSGRIPPTYEEPLREILKEMENWEETMRRFYQLLRQLILARELCKADAWALESHLLVVVNDLNLNRGGVPHSVEFDHFRQQLRFPPEQTHLFTWQELLARTEATLDVAVRPLLDHARRLTYLQDPENAR